MRFHSLMVFFVAAGVAAAEEPDPQLRIARLVRQLGSESYEEREAAGAELAQLGKLTRGELELALASEQLEIRLRAAELLKRLKVADLWAASEVEFGSDGELASRVLAAASEQAGNRILIGDQYGTFHDAPVRLTHERRAFWDLVDDVCRQSGNHVRPHYDTRNPGLVVVAGEPGQYPTAHAGPVRAQVTGARRVFIEELDYQNLRSEQTHTFQLNLQVMWEDRFRLVAYRSQPDVTEATTDSQVELSAMQPAGNGWNVANAGTRQLAMNIRLNPPPTAARRLDTLRLRWGLIAVGDMASLNVENLDSQAPHCQDDLELVVESIEQRQGARCEVKLLVTRDLIIPEPQEILLLENRVELYDAQGRLFRELGQTNSVTERGARLCLSFTGDSAESVAKRLRFVYPRLRSQQDLEIVFRGVPLPAGRPD